MRQRGCQSDKNVDDDDTEKRKTKRTSVAIRKASTHFVDVHLPNPYAPETSDATETVEITRPMGMTASPPKRGGEVRRASYDQKALSGRAAFAAHHTRKTVGGGVLQGRRGSITNRQVLMDQETLHESWEWNEAFHVLGFNRANRSDGSAGQAKGDHTKEVFDFILQAGFVPAMKRDQRTNARFIGR